MIDSIKKLLREELVMEASLTNNDKQVVKFILGDELNEADENGIIVRLAKLLKSNQRKLLTTAALAVLMANPSFANAVQNAPNDIKAEISQMMPGNDSVSDGSATDVSNETDSEFTLNFTDDFDSGKFNVNSNGVLTKLAELKQFLQENDNTSYSITITASESQVPNQAGFGVGELAQKRGSVLKQIVESYIQKNKLGNVNVTIETRIGDIKWDGSNKDDEKYRKDQYVKLDVIAAGITPCDLSFTKNDGSVATSKTNYISFQQELTDDGRIHISPGSIPDRLQIRIGDSIVGDTGYFADAQHSYEEWNFVPQYIAELSELLATSPDSPAIQGLENTTRTFNSFNELIGALLKDKHFRYNKDRRGEIKDGLVKLKLLWEKGQRDFVFYETKKGSIDFKLDQGAKANMLVYSPIGRTGFSIQGQCN